MLHSVNLSLGKPCFLQQDLQNAFAPESAFFSLDLLEYLNVLQLVEPSNTKRQRYWLRDFSFEISNLAFSELLPPVVFAFAFAFGFAFAFALPLPFAFAPVFSRKAFTMAAVASATVVGGAFLAGDSVVAGATFSSSGMGI